MEDRPTLEIPDESWEECGTEEPWHVLVASIVVAGCPMHLEAWAVYRDDAEQPDWMTSLRCHPYEERWAQAHNLFEPDNTFRSVQIRGRDYVLFASPYSSW